MAWVCILDPASAQAVEPSGGWRIRLAAVAPGLGDQGRLTFGSGAGALSGLDEFDEPHPPHLVDRFLDLYVEHQQDESGWGGQFRATTHYRQQHGPALGVSDQGVEFILETDQTLSVDLTWDIIPDLDLATHFLTLTDLEDGAIVDMWAQGGYQFLPTGPRRRFRVEMTAGRPAPPLAYGQSATLPEDTGVGLTLLAEDPEGDVLTYEIVGAPSHGVVSGTGPNVTYVPAADYFGVDSFTFLARDAQAPSNLATVSLIITPVNDAPQAFSQAIRTNEDEATVVTLLGTDVDGDPLTYSIVQGPAHGTLEGTAPELTYQPDRDYGGADSFTFTVTDALIQSAPADVTIAISPVNDPPRAGFTVPGEAASVAIWDNNLGAFLKGASATATSQASPSFPPSNAADDNPATRWVSASGEIAGEILTLALPRGALHPVGGVRLVNAASTDAVKDFEVRVSSTTADPGAFDTVLTDTALADVRVQEFPLSSPIEARYVQLRVLDNHGSPSSVSVASFEVIGEGLGGVRSYSGESFSSGDSASERPENVLDASVGTGWRTAVGQVTDQFLKLRLQAGRDHLIDRVRLASNGGVSSLRDFIVLASSTTDTDAAFVPVVSGTLLNNGQLQEFVLPGGPVRARHVKLAALNNYGGTAIHLSTFQVITAETQGSVVSIPAPMPQLARNESPAQRANGAVVLSFSSSYDASTTPSQMLDYVRDSPWSTKGVTGQFALIRLARRSLLTGVQVSPRLDCCPSQSVKDFEVWTSDTGTDDEAFTRALSGTVQNDGTVQTFVFSSPVQARYVKYVPLFNYGDPQFIATTRFDVMASGAGGVVAASSGPLASAPELALDGNPSTSWRTAAGLVANQWIKVLLAGDRVHQIFGVRVSPEPNLGPRDFEVRVSTTDAAESSFSVVASGTLHPTNAGQEIGFSPVDARYVQFRWLSGYGASFIGVREIEVLGGLEAGAIVRGASSQANVNTAPNLALDSDTANGLWTTASGQNSDQWLTLTLPTDDPIAVDRVALQGQAATSSPRDFEIQVSTTTADPAAFVTAFAGTLRNDGTLQNFFFDPAEARHLRLLLRNNYGGTSVSVQNFKVFSPEFGGIQARFLDQSTSIDGQLTGASWSFGDNASSGDRDPEHLYAAPDVYPVRITATADTGLVGELIRPYRAAGAPATEFDFHPVAPVEGQSILFVDGTEDPSGMVRREWDFGDGAKMVSVGGSVSHVFADNGVFMVTLKATNAFGLSAAAVLPVTVVNVPPNVNPGVNRRWVVNESITFAPSITDPGADPPACVWDFGDGTGATTCAPAHTYTSPSMPADDPVVFTAILTVNDGDGGVVSESVETTVFPPRLHVLVTGLINPIGIDWSPDISRFVVAHRYPNDQLVTVSPDGAVSPTLVPSLGNDEVNLVVSPGLGGFDRGDVYFNAGRNRQVGRLKMDADGNVTQVEGAWILQPSAATYGGITFDTEGGFGHDLLVVWQNGVVYRVNAAGQSTDLGRILGGEAEGATVAGPNFGPASGCLLTVVRFPAKVWAVCPGQAPFVLFDMSSLTQNQPSWIRYVRSPGSLVFTDYQYGRLLRADPQVFGADVAGHAILSTEFGGEVWDLSYDPETAGFKTRLLALAPNSATARFEDITYVPAHGQLSSAAGGAETGSPHTVTLKVEDEAAFAMVGLPVNFAVTGTNPRTGSATTDSAGVATFVYTGVAAGEDTVTVSAFGLPTDPIAISWSGNAAPAAAPQSTTTEKNTAVSILLAGTDPENSPLAYAIVAPPQHGTLSGTAPDVTYAPAPGYVGPDSLMFTVTDDVGATSLPAAISITVLPVNEAPTANSQLVTTAEDTVASIVLSGRDPENEALTFAITVPPQHGAVSGAVPDLLYTPAADYYGADGFAFTVTDASGATSAAAPVSITVTPVNDQPTAMAYSVSNPEDLGVSITLSATDPDNDSLTFTIVTPPQHGALTGAVPDLFYAPAADYYGTDSFTFTAMDASGATSAEATVLVTVTPVNDPPVAQPGSFTTPQEAPAPVILQAQDVENGPESLIFSVTTPPQHGTLSGAAPALTYTPAAGYSGPDVFSFMATDPEGATSSAAVVSIVVTAVGGGNAPPVCSAAASMSNVWPPNHRMEPVPILDVTDPEGEAVTIQVTSIFQDEPVSGTGDGDRSPDGVLLPRQIRAERDGRANGRVYTIQFTATDPLGAACSGSVKICVPKSQSSAHATCGDEGPLFDSTRKHRDDHHCDKTHKPGDHCDKDHSDQNTCTKDHRDGDDEQHSRRGSGHRHDDDGRGKDRDHEREDAHGDKKRGGAR